ncbi:urea ABC transporter substrate-binding protein [Chitinibacteraceae bacterium HSL-7]
MWRWLLLVCPLLVHAEPVRIGLLTSATGTMAVSEAPLRRIAQMAVDEINAEGGVLGRQLEAVERDPGSDWPSYGRIAQQLIGREQAVALFGCWTSVSRKAVLPILEQTGSLLFYPVQYEGEELHPRVVYTGAAPNQQAIPALEYLMSADGGAFRRFVLIGTDYVYPRTTNRILREFLLSRGIGNESVLELYTPFGHRDFRSQLTRIKPFVGDGHVAVISTINGDANQAFFRDWAASGLSMARTPVMAFSVNEADVRAAGKPAAMTGLLTGWNYYMSLENADNTAFVARYRAWLRRNGMPADRAVVNDPMEAMYLAIWLWKQAVEAAGSFDSDAVLKHLAGARMRAPSGFDVRMDRNNHHLYKPVFVGKLREDGQFSIVWRSPSPLKAAAFSPYLQPQD